jgi:CheY-like chemotaxis protein
VIATRPIRILLVEDSPGDVRLTREAMREIDVTNELHVVGDGEAALRFLRREGEHAGAPRPDLVLLDLNLPLLGGHEVLRRVKADGDLRRIPVVVLSTSASEDDVLAAYDGGVNSYVRKPVQLDGFLRVLRSVEEWWLRSVTLPPQ